LDYSKHLLKDLLNVEEDGYTNSKGEQPLLPVNFLRNPKGTVTDVEEQVVSSNGKLVVKPNIKKPTPDQLTAGQWVAANAIILARLVPRFTHQQLCDYLDYERKIGGLLQIFTHSSVFILDNEHRIDHHRVGGKWNKIDPLMVGSILKKKDDSLLPAGVSTSGYRSTSGNVSAGNVAGQSRRPQFKSRGACWAYNSPHGCTFGTDCKYTHVVSTRRGNGPPERAPHFQNNTTGASANT
jgi:hypothetical protein